MLVLVQAREGAIQKGTRVLGHVVPSYPKQAFFVCASNTRTVSNGATNIKFVQFVHAVVLETGARGEGWWMFSLCAALPIVPCSTLVYGEKGY